jgi:hypothetical protein
MHREVAFEEVTVKPLTRLEEVTVKPLTRQQRMGKSEAARKRRRTLKEVRETRLMNTFAKARRARKRR